MIALEPGHRTPCSGVPRSHWLFPYGLSASHFSELALFPFLYLTCVCCFPLEVGACTRCVRFDFAGGTPVTEDVQPPEYSEGDGPVDGTSRGGLTTASRPLFGTSARWNGTPSTFPNTPSPRRATPT